MALKVATGILMAWLLIVALQTVGGAIYDICCEVDPTAKQWTDYVEREQRKDGLTQAD